MRAAAFLRSGNASLQCPALARFSARWVSCAGSDPVVADGWPRQKQAEKPNKKIKDQAARKSLRIRKKAGVHDACLHHTASIIQLERKLDVTRVLRSTDNPHGPSATASIGSVQVHAIEGVEEICPKLNPYPLSNREVLLHAQIHGPKTRTTYWSLS